MNIINTINKTTPIGQLTAVLLQLLLVFPLYAQEKTDGVSTFRFTTATDTAYAPEMNNGEESALLYYSILPGNETALRSESPATAPALSTTSKSGDRLTLKTNLLYYVALMPNVEIEWMFANRWSAALEVQGAWWSKSSPRKVYRLSTVMPEVRYWAIDRSRWHGMYVGVFGGAGLYDLSNDKKGHEGEGFIAGLSTGYMWPIGKSLSLDAGIGVGYMHARDKKYVPLNGHCLYQLTKTINYFGPLRLRLSLVWRFQSDKK